MASKAKKLFVVGGTGAQGIPVIEELVQDGAYSVRVLTRNTESTRAQQLAKLPNVELVTGRLDSDAGLRRGSEGCWGAFVNIDGFVVGQKNEIFWGIRSYQLAQEAGLKFFVWGNLDYVSRLVNYDPYHRCGHYDAKGMVGDFVLSQTRWHEERRKAGISSDRSNMGAALFTSGPYLDMALAAHTVCSPIIAADGVVEWRVPLGRGAVAHVVLEDCGKYVRWLLDNAVSADAFEKVTGKPARWVDISEDEFCEMNKGLLSIKFGKDYSGMQDDDGSIMTWQENFLGFWRMWRASGGDDPLIKRDYQLLDEILPDRVKCAEAWFEKNKELCIRVAWTANLERC